MAQLCRGAQPGHLVSVAEFPVQGEGAIPLFGDKRAQEPASSSTQPIRSVPEVQKRIRWGHDHDVRECKPEGEGDRPAGSR